MKYFLNLWTLNLLATFLIAPNGYSVDESLKISGWAENLKGNLLEISKDDPIFSRLVCPALTRLDLVRNSSELALLQSLKVNKDASSKKVSWNLELKKDLKWWDGKGVTSKDLKSFLASGMKSHLENAYVGIFDLPKYQIKEIDGHTVSIEWQKKPEFGPFFLNRLPFTKKISKRNYLCVGMYKPKSVNRLTHLKKAHKSTATKFASIDFSKKPNPKSKPDDSQLQFQFSNEFVSNPWVRYPDVKTSCENVVPTSILSIIYWNPEGERTKDPLFRKAMTHLTPRGALLRSGAGYLGDLLSGPIPRYHPGYHRRIYVRSFSFDKGAKILASLGYKRPISDEPRITPTKEKMTLKVGIHNPVQQDIHKILADSFTSIGIDFQYVDLNKKSKNTRLDGILMGYKVSFPEVNLLDLLHSKSKLFKSFWDKPYTQFDKKLEAYAASLTNKKPDFKILRQIHSDIYSQEPMSILMQYNQCLKISSKGIANSPEIRITDPDWFKKLIL